MNNFLCDVQDSYPLQKQKKIKKQRKGLGPDYIVVSAFLYAEVQAVHAVLCLRISSFDEATLYCE